MRSCNENKVKKLVRIMKISAAVFSLLHRDANKETVRIRAQKRADLQYFLTLKPFSRQNRAELS
jgi:hypothetical protein